MEKELATRLLPYYEKVLEGGKLEQHYASLSAVALMEIVVIIAYLILFFIFTHDKLKYDEELNKWVKQFLVIMFFITSIFVGSLVYIVTNQCISEAKIEQVNHQVYQQLLHNRDDYDVYVNGEEVSENFNVKAIDYNNYKVVIDGKKIYLNVN